MNQGLKTAVSYSLPSYQLGFCGPQEEKYKKILQKFAAGKGVEEELVKEALTRFEAPYPYFKLIAKSNGIDDPFAEKVVKAMWVGNELLDKVKTEDLRTLVKTDFVKPGLLTRQEAGKRAKKVPDGAVPHHSFHVLILGPVVGRVDLKGPLLDLCRIGWGKVIEFKVQSPKLKIRYKPLVLGRRMRLGEEIEKEINWDRNIVPEVKIGGWVSFHWGEACEVLTTSEVKNLEYYTQKTIDLANQN